WQSVSEMNISASYQLPQPFSLDSLLRLAAAERDAVEDTFWALHEDPGFFQEQLASLVQQYLISCGKAFGKGENLESTARLQAGIHIVLDVCHDIILWEAIGADLENLKILKDGLNTDLQLSKRLPLKYEKALENLMALIFLAWEYAVPKLVHLVMTGHEDFAEFTEKVDDPQGRHMDPRIRKSPNMPPILDLISDIFEPEAKTAGALNFLDKLARMMETDPVQRSLMNADLIKEISKLAALAQIHDALVRHQPTIQITPQDPEPMFRQHYDRLKIIDQLEEYLAGTSLGSYIKPASAFTYPVGSKPTLEHTEQMRQAESKLDNFWDQ
ncbi:MAG: hypothetical protein Q9180_009784, partial [Flavoplaca navasiana]